MEGEIKTLLLLNQDHSNLQSGPSLTSFIKIFYLKKYILSDISKAGTGNFTEVKTSSLTNIFLQSLTGFMSKAGLWWEVSYRSSVYDIWHFISIWAVFAKKDCSVLVNCLVWLDISCEQHTNSLCHRFLV